jgi:GMP synthase (glutamine-hydrolysing)
MGQVMRHPVLIILHQEHSTPGRIGQALQQLGYTLDVRRPRFGEPLPATSIPPRSFSAVR